VGRGHGDAQPSGDVNVVTRALSPNQGIKEKETPCRNRAAAAVAVAEAVASDSLNPVRTVRGEFLEV